MARPRPPAGTPSTTTAITTSPAVADPVPVEPSAEKRRLELLKDAYVKARYSLTWSISREDLEVLAQRIAVLRERTSAVCQAYIDSLSDESAPA
jgi:uncharacterized protein